jgi:hypothetical protein
MWRRSVTCECHIGKKLAGEGLMAVTMTKKDTTFRRHA